MTKKVTKSDSKKMAKKAKLNKKPEPERRWIFRELTAKDQFMLKQVEELMMRVLRQVEAYHIVGVLYCPHQEQMWADEMLKYFEMSQLCFEKRSDWLEWCIREAEFRDMVSWDVTCEEIAVSYPKNHFSTLSGAIFLPLGDAHLNFPDEGDKEKAGKS